MLSLATMKSLLAGSWISCHLGWHLSRALFHGARLLPGASDTSKCPWKPITSRDSFIPSISSVLLRQMQGNACLLNSHRDPHPPFQVSLYWQGGSLLILSRDRDPSSCRVWGPYSLPWPPADGGGPISHSMFLGDWLGQLTASGVCLWSLHFPGQVVLSLAKAVTL